MSRCLTQPVVDIERGARLVEVAVVKDQKVFVIFSEAVDGVRNTFGKVPDVAIAESLSLHFAVLIDSRDDHLASVYDAPFGLTFVSTTRGMSLGYVPRCANGALVWLLSSSVAEHQQCLYSMADPSRLADAPNHHSEFSSWNQRMPTSDLGPSRHQWTDGLDYLDSGDLSLGSYHLITLGDLLVLMHAMDHTENWTAFSISTDRLSLLELSLTRLALL